MRSQQTQNSGNGLLTTTWPHDSNRHSTSWRVRELWEGNDEPKVIGRLSGRPDYHDPDHWHGGLQVMTPTKMTIWVVNEIPQQIIQPPVSWSAIGCIDTTDGDSRHR